MQKEDILSFLKEHKDYLKNNFHIDSIALFGSFARDEANGKSDIDIVIKSSVKSFRNRYKLKKFLEEHLKREVDIGYFDSLRSFIKNKIKDELIYV